MPAELRIKRLGAQGDGVAEIDGRAIYIPYGLPGELVSVELPPGATHTEIVRIIEPSSERTTPPCAHFGACGGCSLQHMGEAAYLEWKRDQVRAALRMQGLAADVEPCRQVTLGTRRRASFTLAQTSGGAKVLGYRRARSHEIVPITSCLVLDPEIVTKLPALLDALSPLMPAGKGLRVSVTAADNGLDVAVENARRSTAGRDAVVRHAAALGIARLTIDGDPAMQLSQPVVEVSGVRVPLPSRAFLQASAEAEGLKAAIVLEGIGKAKRVADLFAGIGTFSFALAKKAAVDAYEQDGDAVNAMAAAARASAGLKPLTPIRRDLFRMPLTARELRSYDAVLFDPPRAGAERQSRALAASDVKRLIAVSCNPATLARDLRILVDGGYRIESVVPIDQFLHSHHVEVVAKLCR